MPRGTQVPAALFSVSGTRLSLALAGLSRPLPLPTPRSRMPALQPRMNESMRFGLIPVRSPLLGESRLISFPSGTEMFHFPEFAPCNLCIQLQVTGYDSRRVSPFRDPRIKGCLAPPRGLSQLTTSFIAFRRQGIHPMLLSTCLLEKNFLPSLFNCKGAASFEWDFSLKEVIQPQVPLRLPCYDFTPIIGPTVDGCLHCWLARRLRVKPTFVV